MREVKTQEFYNELALACINVPDIVTLKNKIKSIRTNYGQELQKILRSQQLGENPVYKPRLIWFEKADRFLRNVSQVGKLSRNIENYVSFKNVNVCINKFLNIAKLTLLYFRNSKN